MVRTTIGNVKVQPTEIEYDVGQHCVGDSYHPIINGKVIETVKIQSRGWKYSNKFLILGWSSNNRWYQHTYVDKKDVERYVKSSMKSSSRKVV